MNHPLDLEDLAHLARVAEGRGDDVPERAIARLILAGLVRRAEPGPVAGPPFELTPAGLAKVRSSDQ